ncbi:MAG TPA: S9 family peptidase [Gemmatimonadaceae bacterium]|nr:S9 family peptidase [Gemmatimonadaceae bacterium]
MRLHRTILLLVTVSTSLRGQASDPGRLTLQRIFASRDFFGERFGPAKWLASGDAYTTLELAVGGGADIVRYDAATGARTVLVPSARLIPAGSSEPITIEDYSWSPDGKRLLVFTNSQRVWRENTRGDFWVLDLDSWRLRKLGGVAKPSTLMFAKFSPDGGRVAYVREHDLYVERLDGGAPATTRLTRDGSPTRINGTFDWVYEEEFSLRDGFRWSPDGRRIAYWQLDVTGVKDFMLIDDTDSLYSFPVPVQYPKAGTTNSAARVGVVSATGGATTWLQVPGDPRNNYIARMDWAGESADVVLQHLNRLQNTLTLYRGDARTGLVTPILVERDSAWVDVVNDLRWLEGGRSFTWVSEKNGWRHLYVVARDGSSSRDVTPGAFDIVNPAYLFGDPFVLGTDEQTGTVYFTASPDNPTQLYLFRAGLDGKGAPTRVTPAAERGTHAYDIAPGGRWAIHSWSSFGTPPVVELVRLPSHEVVRTLVSNAELRSRVAALTRGSAEFFRVRGGGEYDLDAWMIKPPGFDSTKKYPVLFEVYGEPAGQTVQDAWGGAQYLWYLMLAQQGYVVASVDNRGTPPPRGRAWRKSVYRKIGIFATADQTAAARAIAQRPYVDAARIGVWGWSGGGSMTLNLLFRSPDVYRMGMAVAPVTDLRFYDTIYTERYMGLPQDNAEDYRQASPVTFANALRGDLLLVHGSGDDNVHFQNSETLINALVAAGKPFQMMDYPNRTHCICERQGTTMHLYSLLTRYLEEHLPR